MSIFKNRTVIGVICILLALVICFGITPLYLDETDIRRAATNMAEVRDGQLWDDPAYRQQCRVT